PLPPVSLPVDEASGLVVAKDIVALVDCPSVPTSLKDGYAIISTDLQGASKPHPVRLKISGMATAGGDHDLVVETGSAVKVMTGAKIPAGADAVAAIEFISEEGGWVRCYRDAGPGKNILPQGTDVAKGSLIAAKGEVLTPAKTGFVAAGGIYTIQVHPRPRVGVIATGDEVVAPGKPLRPGQLYASNLVTLLSWLRHFRIQAEAAVVPDKDQEIRKSIETMLERVDVLLTSGGAWKSERDLTTRILAEMGGKTVFHRVRIGPGKAVALILLQGKAIFCLPGGPPSNEMAFLQIALPGLCHLAARLPVPFAFKTARLSAPVGGDIDWTQFVQARLEKKEGHWVVTPLKLKS
ncbi:MAG: molybdopterin molybdotransferase MoeA, partial [Desulfobacteraceae bacterium]|nr:molybdopterin molybdotransferase MoeA [Desulfobacteraceae bacterium]